MAGNAKNTALWTGADVYIAPEGTDGPTEVATPWPSGWDVVGLLDGDEGFTETRDEDSDEHYAWGGLLIKRTKSHHKRTFKFVALEDNAVTFGLVNPGSTRTSENGLIKSSIVVPVAGARFAIGFELRDGSHTKRRFALSAEVQEVGDITENETDPVVFEITVVLFPDEDGVLYHTVENDPNYVSPE